MPSNQLTVLVKLLFEAWENLADTPRSGARAQQPLPDTRTCDQSQIHLVEYRLKRESPANTALPGLKENVEVALLLRCLFNERLNLLCLFLEFAQFLEGLRQLADSRELPARLREGRGRGTPVNLPSVQ